MPASLRVHAALLLIFPLFGCRGREPSAVVEEPPKPAAPPAPVRNPKIPVEVSYPIMSEKDEIFRESGKRTVEVRVNMRVPTDVLREIALEVKGREKRQYERTWIFFYLLDEVAGKRKRAWATGTSTRRPT